MSYFINRLIKSKDSKCNDEVFVELCINDDLGAYAYGRWMTPAEFAELKAELGQENYTKFQTLKDVVPDPAAKAAVLADLAKITPMDKGKPLAPNMANPTIASKIQQLAACEKLEATAVKLAAIADRHIPVAWQFRVAELAAIAKMPQVPMEEPKEESLK